MKKLLLVLLFLVLTIIFFYPVIFKGLLPIPTDNIVGLYHPFRDFFAEQFPNGIPFKNFLLTDPVRQQYPWKELVTSAIKTFQLPLWNPYNFSGTPLLANFQSSPFYILNIFLLILPFKTGWSLLIISQVFLSCVFLFVYLRNLKLSVGASIFGAIAFSFSGFSIAWLEWGTILQTALWLPLILYFTDKLFFSAKKIYIIPLVISLCFALFAGHPQIAFYVVIFFLLYYLARFLQIRKKEFIVNFFLTFVPFLIITSIQWLPTVQFSLLSARAVDINWHVDGWFIPWQNLIQFIAPDFFGNPATLNYWGVWNYGEFANYLGILPFIFGVFCLIFRKDRKTLFFGSAFFISLIFSLPTIFAKLPFILNVPFLSSFQPTRLVFITDFSFAVLAALGIDYFYKQKKNIFYPVLITGIIFIALWLFVLIGSSFIKSIKATDLLVSKSNLYFPTLIFVISVIILFINVFKKNKQIFFGLIIVILIFDLFRFGWKFTPFSSSSYLYPTTKTIEFLQKQKGPFRIMQTDARILPPNFSIIYRLQSVDGYDSLYLLNYGELMAAIGRNNPDISAPFGFNRIINLQSYHSSFINTLNVKYVLSIDEINSSDFKKVFEEGQTKVYENLRVNPRTFFVDRTINESDKQKAINLLFDKNYSPSQRAVIDSNNKALSRTWSMGTADVIDYQDNKVVIQTNNEKEGFLVFSDSFYPSWHANIDGKESKIYKTNYAFRGVIVPAGKHKIEFINRLF